MRASIPFISGINKSNRSDVRVVQSELLNRFAPVGGFGHQTHARLIGDKRGNPFPDEGVVVDGQNADKIFFHKNQNGGFNPRWGYSACPVRLRESVLWRNRQTLNVAISVAHA
jgi:hypothetical protein